MTKNIKDVKSDHWCFTSFDPRLDQDYKNFRTTQGNLVEATYYVIGREICPQTGKKHDQGYLELNTRVRGAQLIKAWPGVHWEVREFGSAAEAANYCKKPDKDDIDPKVKVDKLPLAPHTYYEYGEISNAQRGKRTDIDDIKKAVIDEGRQVREIIPLLKNQQDLRFAEGLIKYQKVRRNEPMEVRWYWGPTGVGKTRRAWDEAITYDGIDDVWQSAEDLKWWDGYSGHKNVIFDDFRGGHVQFATLLRILDRYPFNVPIKGSMAPLLAKRIWITSPYHPRDVYTSDRTIENIDQLLRRITVIEKMEHPNKVLLPPIAEEEEDDEPVEADYL